MKKTYNELMQLQTFEERFKYLQLKGIIGEKTFDDLRFMNQSLYTSKEWRAVRDQVLIRDNCCDLGLEGLEIYDRPTVHHIEPLTIEDVELRTPKVFDMNNLITVSYDTHLAIHYNNSNYVLDPLVERKPNDTIPWK